MLLRASVWGTDTWYEQVAPMLAAAGFQERADLHAADPESDGELMYLFFDLTSDELSYAEFTKLVEQASALLKKAEAPPLELTLVNRK